MKKCLFVLRLVLSVFFLAACSGLKPSRMEFFQNFGVDAPQLNDVDQRVVIQPLVTAKLKELRAELGKTMEKVYKIRDAVQENPTPESTRQQLAELKKAYSELSEVQRRLMTAEAVAKICKFDTTVAPEKK